MTSPKRQRAASSRATATGKTDRSPILIGAAAIVLVTLYAYAQSFGGVFVFDDRVAVAQNPNIRTLWPLTRATSAPEETTLSGRPVASFSFALTYALAPADARDVLTEPAPGARASEVRAFYRNLWTYHAVNLGIHALAALTLFGLLRRTLGRITLTAVSDAALPLALVVTLIWAVHPLQTSAVTYVMQRVESLMALFYLLTIYCAVRAWDARHRSLWTVASIASCALAMGTKEAAVTAPIMVIMWDWLASAPAALRRSEIMSAREIAARRWPLYAGLAATWLVLAWLMASGPRAQSVGFGFERWPWTTYLITQAEIVAHYLRLAIVPRPLVLDYEWPPAASIASVWRPLLVLLPLAAITVALVWRRHPAAFAGVWLFGILAPTSSVVPIATQSAAEHRMYLPLAAVIAIVVVGAYAACVRLAGSRRRAWTIASGAAAAAIVLVFARMTDARNLDYHDYARIWLDTVQKRPENARARVNYATALLAQGRHDEAANHLRRAVALSPDSVDARANLGVALCVARVFDACIEQLQSAILIDPRYVPAHRDLADAYASTGRHALALQHYLTAIEHRGDDPFLLNRAGWLLATSTEPEVRDGARARALAERAVAIAGRGDVTSLDTLAAAHAESGDFDRAVTIAIEARRAAGSSGRQAQLAELESRIAGYRARQPMREAPQR